MDEPRTMMYLTVATFVFAAIVGKALLGCAVVYCFLPIGPACPICDGDTLRLRPRWGSAVLFRLARLERRWCPGCRKVSIARGQPTPRVWVGPAERPRAGVGR